MSGADLCKSFGHSKVVGAGPCPRARGHAGECYWWLAWEGDAGWRVIVYSGDAYNRQRRCKGSFIAEPDVRDVGHLLRVLSPLKKREVAKRTPASEPPSPRCTPLYRLERRGEEAVIVRG